MFRRRSACLCWTLVSISSDLVDPDVWVRMGDERSKHAMLQQVFQDLGDLFDAVALDDEVRVVRLTRAGRRFSTGGSVTGMAERASRQEGIDLSHRSSVLLLGRMYRNLLGVDQPVIAAVNGDAIGAGTTIALHCGPRLAAQSARFGDPHVDPCLVASAGAYVLPLLTSLNVAKEYLLTGDLMSAVGRRTGLGLVNHVYPDAEIQPQGRGARRPASRRGRPTRLLRLDEAPPEQGRPCDQRNEILGDGIAHEMLTFTDWLTTARGSTQFLEKRPARFEGRWGPAPGPPWRRPPPTVDEPKDAMDFDFDIRLTCPATCGTSSSHRPGERCPSRWSAPATSGFPPKGVGEASPAGLAPAPGECDSESCMSLLQLVFFAEETGHAWPGTGPSYRSLIEALPFVSRLSSSADRRRGWSSSWSPFAVAS